MISALQDRLIEALAKRNLTCPDLKVEQLRNTVRFSMPRNKCSARYSDGRYDDSDGYTADYYADINDFEKDFDRRINNIAKHVSSWIQTEHNQNVISTIDAFFAISGEGTIEMPFEVDQLLITTLERVGHSINDLIESIGWVIDRQDCANLHAVRDVAASSFTNVDPSDMGKYFHSRYRRLNELEPRYRHALPFQGCLFGKQLMAFDIRLAVGVHYKSSSNPTITLRNRDIPETMLASLKGRPINDLLDDRLFSEDVMIRNAARGDKTINLTISPDRVDITHLGRQHQQIKKAA